jgi:hypothetical protein
VLTATLLEISSDSMSCTLEVRIVLQSLVVDLSTSRNERQTVASELSLDVPSV